MRWFTFGKCERANPAALEFLPHNSRRILSEPAKFPQISRKRDLLKCFVYMRNARKLLMSATLTR